jgi:N-acetylmuramoyl-L-alanine amidase
MYKMKIFKQLSVLTILFTVNVAVSQSKFKVALDAGHGAHDFGAVHHGYIEKNIALAVTLKVGKILEKKSDIDVVYTRKTDVFIDLIERANIANRANANVFVSIHCNANKNTTPDGTETYVMGMSKNASNLEAARKENKVVLLEKDYEQKYKGFDPKSPESFMGMTIMQEEYLDNSISLAGSIQKEFMRAGKKSRGVKQAPFMVLHKAYMPRVLIEMGFISNVKEGAELNSEEGQDKIAQAIANAIIDYKKENFDGEEPTVKPSQKMEEVEVKSPSTISTTKPISETKPVETKPTEIKNDLPSGVVFKVQLSASGTKLDLIPSNFNGLSPISVLTEGNLYKYMYGQTSSYDEAKRLMQEARSKGYSSAFVIAFKNGKKVSVQEALKQ